MFFPYRDDNPRRHGPPIITIAIIIACACVYILVQLPLALDPGQVHTLSFGFIPAVFYGNAELVGNIDQIPSSATLITSMFLHGGIIHLIGNMWFLWLYGDNVEEEMGRFRYFIFYLVCGCVGTLAHSAIDPNSRLPLIGASGAISGVIASYLLLWPRANIRVFYWWFVFVGRINVPAFVVGGVWLLEQFFALPAALQAQGGVAIVAHLGGFVSGLILTPFLKRPEVRLFQPRYTAPFSRKQTRFIRQKKGSVPEVRKRKN